jgi:hypothetical protein
MPSAQRDLGGDGVRQEERHRFGESVGADVEHGHEIADVGRGHDRRLAEDVEARAQGTGDGDGHHPAAETGRGPRAGRAARPITLTAAAERAEPMLLAHEGRPQDVMHAAIEDHDDRAVDGLAVDDPGQVSAGRPDQEPARLEQEPCLGQDRIGIPGVGDRGQPRTQPHKVERLLVGLVRDAEAAAGVH